MSLRTRPISSGSTAATPPDDTKQPILAPPPPALSLSQRAISQTLSSTANLANLLPTGTLLAFQFLIPTFTNHGSCDPITRLFTQLLLLFFASFCFFASFTDSFSPQGDTKVYYGLATFRGMWLFDYPNTHSNLPDLSSYRLRFVDGIHAVLSVFVFVAVALRDANVLGCFYPHPQQPTQQILDIVPLGIGVICSLLFIIFPTRRHGIGYPVSSGK